MMMDKFIVLCFATMIVFLGGCCKENDDGNKVYSIDLKVELSDKHSLGIQIYYLFHEDLLDRFDSKDWDYLTEHVFSNSGIDPVTSKQDIFGAGVKMEGLEIHEFQLEFDVVDGVDLKKGRWYLLIGDILYGSFRMKCNVNKTIREVE